MVAARPRRNQPRGIASALAFLPSRSTLTRHRGQRRLELVRRALEEHRPPRRARQQRRRRAPAAGRLSRHERRGIRLVDADELLLGLARDAGRPRPDARAGCGRDHRERRAQAERVFRAGCGRARLRRCQSTALVNLAKSLAQEFGARGISSTPSRRAPYRPGPAAQAKVASLFYRRQGNRHRPGHRAQERARQHRPGFATGRLTTPEEVAALVVFAVAATRSNTTGSNVVIDGGLIKTST